MSRSPAPSTLLAPVRTDVGVRLDGVTKGFGPREVVRDVRLELAPGAVVGIVAPNGSGKTTLLRILAGVLDPDAGDVRIGDAPPGTGRTGYLPAGDRSLYWRLTVRENLLFHARLGGLDEDTATSHVTALAAAVGAEHLLDTRVDTLSTGERRRAAVAVAFAAARPVVLLDEPWADLDEPGRDDVGALVRRWADGGGLVVYAAPAADQGPAPDLRLTIEGGALHGAADPEPAPGPAARRRQRPGLGKIVRAFVSRDFGVALSYRLPFVLDIVAAAFTVLTFLFVSKIVAPDRVTGGDYLPFVMVGLVFAAFLQAGVSTVAGNVRREQMQGTLELTLASGVPVPLLAFGMTAYPLVTAATRAGAYVGLAAWAGARVPGANWPLGVGAVLLASLSFAGLGLVGAAVVLWIRQAASATAWLVSAMTLAGGALFPPELLPGWAQVVSDLSPFTVALRLARGAVLEGSPVGAQAAELAGLAGLAVAYVAIGVGAMALALRRAKRTGGLGGY